MYPKSETILMKDMHVVDNSKQYIHIYIYELYMTTVSGKKKKKEEEKKEKEIKAKNLLMDW